MTQDNPTLALQIAIQANEPVILWGEPGTAKTSIMAAFAAQWGWWFRSPSLANSEPADVIGAMVPDTEGRFFRYVPASWAFELSRERIGDEPGLLVLDEWSTAPPTVQNCGMRIVNESRVGDTPLGPNVRRVALANPADTTTGAFDLTAPGANRFVHIDWQFPTRWMAAQARKGFPVPATITLPDGWRDRIPYYFNLIATFWEVRPELMQALPKDDSERGRGWPSCRTWTMGARLLAAAETFGADVQTQLLIGCVGESAALEHMTWVRNLDLPLPQDVLADPRVVPEPPPGQDHRMYAILGGVMHVVRQTVKDIDTADETVLKAAYTTWIAGWRVLVHIGQWTADIVLPFAVELYEMKPVQNWETPPEAKAILERLAEDSGLLSEA